MALVALIVALIYLGGLTATAVAWLIVDIRTDRDRDPTPALWWPLLLWRWMRAVFRRQIPPRK
jgi:hypothetical protein